ncbi:unnamed protein product [Pleuronectes platessa]|uniref:Uncharacterized protein n=1 Tax=Pleuronectes platessa TaxID=8262 RepID=A0A9N7TMB3_PLEPL|nr:unnamed protein product [Pleuronectes platessa]
MVCLQTPAVIVSSETLMMMTDHVETNADSCQRPEGKLHCTSELGQQGAPPRQRAPPPCTVNAPVHAVRIKEETRRKQVDGGEEMNLRRRHRTHPLIFTRPRRPELRFPARLLRSLSAGSHAQTRAG